MSKNIIFILLILTLLSCKTPETIEDIVFDNSNLSKIIFNAETKEVNIKYQAIANDPYIDYSLKVSPKKILENWILDNINIIGSENKLVINILNSSLTKENKINIEAKNYEEKEIYFYKLDYIIEYIIYDDFNNLLASTVVVVSRSTTSGQFISLNQSEKIINKLIFNSLVDASLSSKDLTAKHMYEYIL